MLAERCGDMLKAVSSDKSVMNFAARANDWEGKRVAEYQIGCIQVDLGFLSHQYLPEGMPAPEFRRQETSGGFQQALAHVYNGDNRRIMQFADQIDLVAGARMDDAIAGLIQKGDPPALPGWQ
jgi:hypothetical protein